MFGYFDFMFTTLEMERKLAERGNHRESSGWREAAEIYHIVLQTRHSRPTKWIQGKRRTLGVQLWMNGTKCTPAKVFTSPSACHATLQTLCFCTRKVHSHRACKEEIRSENVHWVSLTPESSSSPDTLKCEKKWGRKRGKIMKTYITWKVFTSSLTYSDMDTGKTLERSSSTSCFPETTPTPSMCEFGKLGTRSS